MTKQEFKQQQRQRRIEANGGIGLRIAKLVAGEQSSNYDNSRIWQLRNEIAREILPIIVKRQRAWANMQ